MDFFLILSVLLTMNMQYKKRIRKYEAKMHRQGTKWKSMKQVDLWWRIFMSTSVMKETVGRKDVRIWSISYPL